MTPENLAGATAAESEAGASVPTADTGLLFSEAAAIMACLRGPDGCPWDREQTPSTIRPYTLEETYEVLDAIDRGDAKNLCEELGDLLLQVLFYAQMAAEAGEFSIDDVLRGLSRKLIRRHPHVFGTEASVAAGMHHQAVTAEVEGRADTVVSNWRAIKQREKPDAEKTGGRLDAVLRAQPALQEAEKLGSAAARIGFDWPAAAGLLEKIREEAAEVEAELKISSEPTPALQLEVGDLLVVTANLARHLKVSPEMALRDANAKFRRRFASMEAAEMSDGDGPLEERSLEALETLWAQAKQQERAAEMPA